MFTRMQRPRRSVRAVGVGAMLAVLAGVLMPLSPTAPASEAEAAVASGGSGQYRGIIDWATWGEHGTQIANGRSSVSTKRVGTSTLVTTCTISGIRADDGAGNIYAYRTGAWQGDALDDLYNVGGAGASNQLIYGIANRVPGVTNDGTMRFTVQCEAKLDGTAVPLRGLVVADAEQNNNASGQSESIAATPSNSGAIWRIVERSRTAGCSTGTNATLATADNRLQLMSSGAQCAGAPGGPIAIAYMENSSGGTFSLTSQGGAASALAIGAVLEGDFGDAPSSYGDAGAVFTSAWSGGTLQPGTTTNVFNANFKVATHQPGAIRLGSSVDADPGHQPSARALADDETGADDEDTVITYNGLSYNTLERPILDLRAVPGTTETFTVSCSIPQAVTARVKGWLDFNRNGVFDVATESSSVGTCSSGTATLTWAIPGDVKPAAGSDPTFLRLRIADVSAALSPNGMATTGEVEDHAVALAAPDFTLTKTSNVSDSTPITPEQNIAYEVALTNAGRQPLRTPGIVDELGGVLNGATFVRASVRVASGPPTPVALANSRLTWTGTSDLAVGASAVMTVELKATSSGRGLVLTNRATGSATSGNSRPVKTASVSNPVGVALEVRKRWIVDGETYENGLQKPWLTSDLQVSERPSATWGKTNEGFAAGSTVQIGEQTQALPAWLPGCSITEQRITDVNGAAQSISIAAAPASVSLTRALNTVTVTDVVTCNTTMTLATTVEGGPATAADFMLIASDPSDAAVLSGPGVASGAIAPGVEHRLDSPGPATYVPSAWECQALNAAGQPVDGSGFAGSSGDAVQVPRGMHARCTVVQQTAQLTLLKLIDPERAGTLKPEHFSLTAKPVAFDGLHAVSVTGDASVQSGPGGNTFNVRPGHTYSLSESSRYAFLRLSLERYDGTPAGGVFDEARWQEVDSFEPVAVGGHAFYRFVNAAPTPLTLPLTGGIGADTYLIGGAGVLLLGLLAVAIHLIRTRVRSCAARLT